MKLRFACSCPRISGSSCRPCRASQSGFRTVALYLTQVMNLDHRQGFQALRHAEGRLAVEVTSGLNTRVSTTDQILTSLEAEALPDIASRYNVRYSFEGRAADQRETLGDMQTGLVIGLALMYVVLAWVFASWSLPLIVMAIIPFALVGALLGHWLMGLQLTILSLFGLFGLSGIVVNNAIILVAFYNQQRKRAWVLPMRSTRPRYSAFGR